MSEKKKKHNAKLPKNCSLQIQNPDFLFQTPDFCVFQTSYVQSTKKICCENLDYSLLKQTNKVQTC